MNLMKSLNFLFLLLVSSFVFTSCGDDEEVTPKTIVDVVVENPNFTLLEAAVLHAGSAPGAPGPRCPPVDR